MEKIEPQMIEDLKVWVRNEARGLDDSQAALLLSMLDMVSILLKNKTTQKKAVETLRQLMGILPKSERGKTDKFDLSPKPDSPADPEKSALEKKIHALLKKYQQLYGHKPERHREGKRTRHEREQARHGGEETLYAQTERSADDQGGAVTVDREQQFKSQTGLRSSKEKHIRYDFEVVITRITTEVETVTDPTTGQSVRASTRAQGPEGWQITWNAIINIVHLVVVFSMPAHRAAAYLGNNLKAFGESTILRAIQYAAFLCVPIYQEIFRQMAQSRRLAGDDSSTRVLGVERQVKRTASTSRDEAPPPPEEVPIEAKSNSSKPEIAVSLESEMEGLDKLLGFAFDGKAGKPKKRLQVTMVTGRVEAEDQFSQISFVRTHLGSFGNLLDRLLEGRASKHDALTVQSDQSTANLPSEPRGFRITKAACMAHARRPFWRYRDVDPLNCYQMLRGFALLSIVEDIIDCRGRDEEVTLYWRGRYGTMIWRIIKSHCDKIMNEQMPNSELYTAAKYVVTHYEELTYYLKDSWVHPTNNQVERILRSERVMLNNSKFRQSKKGRVAFDILRTIQLSCAGARVQFLDYLKWVLPNHEAARRKPSDWTPYAYRKKRQLEV